MQKQGDWKKHSINLHDLHVIAGCVFLHRLHQAKDSSTFAPIRLRHLLPIPLPLPSSRRSVRLITPNLLRSARNPPMLIWIMRTLLSPALSRLRICRILLQILVADRVQCFVLARMQMHPWHGSLRKTPILCGLQRFLPAMCAETPFHAVFGPGLR